MNEIEKQRILIAMEAEKSREKVARERAISAYFCAVDAEHEMQKALCQVAAMRVTLYVAAAIVLTIKLNQWGLLP